MQTAARQDQYFTVDQYHRMIECGVLGEGDAVELLENQIVHNRFSPEQCLKMVEEGIISEEQAFTPSELGVDSEMPRNPAHDSTIERLDEALRPLLPAKWRLRIQSAIRLLGGEPEPGLAVVRGPVGRYDDHHPEPRDIALLIEVCDTTLAYDSGIKLRSYAALGFLRTGSLI